MKRNVALRAVLVAAGALAACAPTMHLTPAMRRRAAAIPILTSEQVGTRKFTVLDEVVGRSCVRGVGADPSIDLAREELKVRAAALNADAVTGTLCKAGGGIDDVLHSCAKSIECRGDAIRWAL